MDIEKEIESLLISLEKKGEMPSIAYDTAWAARLKNSDISDTALEWLRQNQLPEGCWGTETFPYYHERLINTLIAIIALAESGEKSDLQLIKKATGSLETSILRLHEDVSETIGFEMIVPTLWNEMIKLGITDNKPSEVEKLDHLRKRKILALPDMKINRYVTHACSAEMAGIDEQYILDVDNLLEDNGSVGDSPSATTYFLMCIDPNNHKAINYLQEVAKNNGGIMPFLAPFDIFESGWAFWNILTARHLLTDQTSNLVKTKVGYLVDAWSNDRGVGFSAEYSVTDGDDTAVIFDVLSKCGYRPLVDAVYHYEESTHFRSYDYELNPSISTNIHVLGALRQAGISIDHPTVQKILNFLSQQGKAGYWFDKWHISPYYSTAHMIINSLGYCESIIQDAIHWMITSQRKDGSWGYYLPTAEETAYCLQALTTCSRHGWDIPKEVIKLGSSWLEENMNEPYPPLWIGKCLYSPTLIIRSSILSALMLSRELMTD